MATATNWVSRGNSWRSDQQGTTNIAQGWQSASYGQSKTFMTAMKIADLAAGEYINSFSFTFTPSGGYGSSYNKALKIVRPISTASKTFTSSTTSESVRPTSSTELQSETVKNGTSYTITANSNVLSYLKEGYNYIIICNFETTAYSSSYDWSLNYINSTVDSISYTTTKYTYAVSYKKGSNGTGTETSDAKTYGTDLKLKGATFTRTGYTQTGWSTTDGGAKAYDLSATYTANEAITLYPYWTANTYTVQYNGNGNTGGSTASSTHTYGVAKNLTANGFTRAYTVTYDANSGSVSPASGTATYTFSKWNTNSSGTGTDYNNKASVTSLTTSGTFKLYAQWTPGSVTLPTPTRTGYTFAGWYTAASGGTLVGAAGASYTPTAATTLYAHWNIIQYTISYNANGGTGAPSAQTKNYGTALTLSSTTPTKDSTVTYPTGTITVSYNANGGSSTPTNGTGTYTNTKTQPFFFCGWSTASNGTGTSYTAGGLYTDNASATLYAQYGAGTATTTRKTNPSITTASAISRAQGSATGYVVTFNGQGGTSPTSQTSSRTVTYTFNKWNAASDGSGTAYSAATTYTFSTNTTLYATWTSSYTNNAITLPSTSRTGYTFAGWYTAASGGTRVGGSGSSYTPTAATTLYAHWTTNAYSIDVSSAGTYKATVNGGGDYDYGSSYTVEAIYPEDCGYKFNYFLKDGSTYIYTNPYSNTISGAVSFVAYSQPIQYTITFNSNSGSGLMTTMTCDYDSSYNLTTNTFSKIGYAFKGWSTDPNATTATYEDEVSIKNLTYVDGATITLYAIWKPTSQVFIWAANAAGEYGWRRALKYIYNTQLTPPTQSLTVNTTAASDVDYSWSVTAGGATIASDIYSSGSQSVLLDKAILEAGTAYFIVNKLNALDTITVIDQSGNILNAASDTDTVVSYLLTSDITTVKVTYECGNYILSLTSSGADYTYQLYGRAVVHVAGSEILLSSGTGGTSIFVPTNLPYILLVLPYTDTYTYTISAAEANLEVINEPWIEDTVTKAIWKISGDAAIDVKLEVESTETTSNLLDEGLLDVMQIF